MRTLYTLLLASMAFGLFAQQGQPQSAAARGAALGNASVAFTDINAAYSNQAGLAFLEELSFSAYGERRFLAEGLNSFLFAAAYPLENNQGTFGLTLNYFGFSAYNEQKIGLAYARKLSERFALGVQLDYLGIRIPTYGSANSFTFELGLTAKISEELTLAAHVYNPVHAKLGQLDERLPALFNLGLAYHPSEKVGIYAALEKDIYNQPFGAKAGIEYQAHKIFKLRAGMQLSDLSQLSFGLGLDLDELQIDLATAYHQVLGFTPSFALSYRLQKTKKAAEAKTEEE
ncbi:hypothetical protein [Saprospira grandis]|uniref:hypothetical protein n=1 Tax=Saprospira grandis TaxID=1008 RepID=UPI0022DD2F93|nr:hypothetical protein [Saprospira grandis]WBM73695.1 hypothetical protein OP864_11945 [Saprospira grandis]